MDKKLVVAADLGNSKIVIAAAWKSSDNSLEIIDLIQKQTNDEIKNGVIKNHSSLLLKITEMVKKIEDKNKFKIGKINFAVSPHTLNSVRHNVICEPSNDLTALANTLKNNALNIEVSPQRKTVDAYPMEMNFGANTNGNFLVISVLSSIKEQINKFENNIKTFYQPSRYISVLAEAEMLLSKEQKINGSVFIDFGAGCTSFAAYKNGYPCICGVVPLGGNHVTADIAKRYEIDFDLAEKIKLQIGIASPQFITDKKTFNVNNSLTVNQEELATVIVERETEILNFILQEIESQNIGTLSEGYIISGGASKMRFLPEFISQLLDIQVVAVKPKATAKNLEAEYSLLQSLLESCNDDCLDDNDDKKKRNKSFFGMFDMFNESGEAKL
jgi:cell division protein FtsA